MRGIIEGWRAEAEAEAEACTTFDPKEDVLVILSGGVDSSLTFHLAASLYGVRHCITLLADEGAATDAPWCRAVAAYVGQHTLAPQGLTVDHEVRWFLISVVARFFFKKRETGPGFSIMREVSLHSSHHPPHSHTPQKQILTPTLPQLLSDDMPFLTQTLASFDPMALRNSICVARVLQHAKARGFRHVLTGDAADELLVGYSFSARLPEAEWRRHRQGMCARMHFDAMDVGKALGVHVASPYLDPAFVAFALGLSKEDCVAPVLLRPTPDISLADAPLTTTGKIPIRQAFPMLPTASRRKDPVEIGCGTTLLGAAPWATPPRPRGYFDERIDDGAFEAERAAAQSRHGIVLRDKEHLAYFRGFRALFEVESSRELSVPGKPRPNDDPCPGCGFPLPHEGATFCYTCGHYDAKLEFRHDGSGRRSTTGDGGGGGGGLEGV